MHQFFFCCERKILSFLVLPKHAINMGNTSFADNLKKEFPKKVKSDSKKNRPAFFLRTDKQQKRAFSDSFLDWIQLQNPLNGTIFKPIFAHFSQNLLCWLDKTIYWNLRKAYFINFGDFQFGGIKSRRKQEVNPGLSIIAPFLPLSVFYSSLPFYSSFIGKRHSMIGND